MFRGSFSGCIVELNTGNTSPCIALQTLCDVLLCHSRHCVSCCVELAQSVVDAGAVPLLILCLQEPELALKRVAASSLSDVCKHSLELAQTVVDAGAIAHLAQMILNPDAKLKVVK